MIAPPQVASPPGPPRRVTSGSFERPKRQRRSLTNVGGEVELWGADASEAQAVAHALDVSPDDDSRHHIHGFHTYPARLHPTTAQRLVEQLAKPGAVVLDPFCGSGTVLVEARIAGLRGRGVDANPLAVELSRLKTRGYNEHERAAILAGAHAVVESAEDRRHRRAGATRRYPPEDTSLYDPHVLLELDGLRAGITGITGTRGPRTCARLSRWCSLRF